MTDVKTMEREAGVALAKVINETFQGCPWHLDKKPVPSVSLVGNRDEPSVVVHMTCPTCGVVKAYGPSEAEVQKHYINRYTYNLPMALGVIDKLRKRWNRS